MKCILAIAVAIAACAAVIIGCCSMMTPHPKVHPDAAYVSTATPG